MLLTIEQFITVKFRHLKLNFINKVWKKSKLVGPVYVLNSTIVVLREDVFMISDVL